MAERAEVGTAECLEATGGGLGDLARGLDLVIEQDEHAEPARFRARRGADGVHEVQAGVRRERARRALRTDDHDGHLDLGREREGVGRLFERSRAVQDDDARKAGMVGDGLFGREHEGLPFGEVDGRRGYGLEADGDDLGDLVDFRVARDELIGFEHGARIAVLDEIERAEAAHGGDGAARPDDGDLGFRAHDAPST